MGGTSESATCLAQNAHFTKRICQPKCSPQFPDSIPKSYSEILFWKRMSFNSICCSAYWGSTSRDIQTELQNCLAYWGVKAHIFHSACCSAYWGLSYRIVSLIGAWKRMCFNSTCCSAYWGMNPRFKRYSNLATELFRLLGREGSYISWCMLLCFLGDESKRY